MEFKGTKGKWSFKNNSIIYSGNVPIASSFTLISTVDETRLQNESWLDMRKRTEPERIACYIEQKANTLLISKAPEMLEMLQSIADGECPDLKDIKKLIKEVTELK